MHSKPFPRDKARQYAVFPIPECCRVPVPAGAASSQSCWRRAAAQRKKVLPQYSPDTSDSGGIRPPGRRRRFGCPSGNRGYSTWPRYRRRRTGTARSTGRCAADLPGPTGEKSRIYAWEPPPSARMVRVSEMRRNMVSRLSAPR